MTPTTTQAKTIFWGKPQAAALPLSPRSVGVDSPRTSNTGGYEVSKENSKLEKGSFSACDNLTAIDWLRVTTNDYKNYAGAIPDIEGILAECDMKITWKDKGFHGYDKSASITLWKDNDYLTVGNLACSEDGNNKGGLLELTGTGCKVLQIEHPELWLELYSVLAFSEWRISRIDVALDLPGEYALANNYTVPMLLWRSKMVEGLFNSDRNRNPDMKLSFAMAGDWTDLNILFTHQGYNPLQHCPGGLTLYVGKRGKSDDFFRVYEKGKELLGKMAEPEAIDRAWVRIEHEMTRSGTGRNIPLDVMLRPDVYWCAGRSGVRGILNKLRADKAMQEAQSWKRDMFKREKGLMLSRKIHWAKHTYGRLVRTLFEKGLTPEEICGLLEKELGLKEFIFDLADEVPTAETILQWAA